MCIPCGDWCSHFLNVYVEGKPLRKQSILFSLTTTFTSGASAMELKIFQSITAIIGIDDEDVIIQLKADWYANVT